MKMMKKVAVLNGRIEHVYHSEKELNEFIVDGATIEEREMEYSSDYGWREVGYKPPITLEDYVLELEFRLALLELGL